MKDRPILPPSSGCPCITSSAGQLPPWHPPASCSRSIILLPPQTQGVLFQELPLFFLPPPAQKPRVGMTKEPHGMALPLMEKNKKDANAEAGMKNEEKW